MKNRAARAVALCIACLAPCARAADDDRVDNGRKVSPDRVIIRKDSPDRNYQRPMTPDQKKAQAQYEQSRRCYARFTVKGGGLRPGAEQACGPALKDPSASP